VGLMPMPQGGDVPGIDADSERGRAFFLIAAIVAFLVSAWHTVQEIRYAARGRTTKATVVRATPASEPGRGRPKEYLRVEVEFSDAGQTRQTVLKKPLGAPITSGQQVDVEYLPDVPDRVRFRGDRPTFWILVFVGSTAGMIWLVTRLAAESHRGTTGSRRQRRRRSPS
jgi:hypothetical protein